MKLSIKIIHWAPRILCVLAILFISMFALDAFDQAHSVWQQLADFFLHLIPSFVLIALLIVAWKWELIGGVVFIIIGLGLSPFIFLINHDRNHFSTIQSLITVLLVNVPFITAGILFILSYYRKKRDNILPSNFH